MRKPFCDGRCIVFLSIRCIRHPRGCVQTFAFYPVRDCKDNDGIDWMLMLFMYGKSW